MTRTGRWDVSVYCLSRSGTFLEGMESQGVPVAGPVAPWSWLPWRLVSALYMLYRYLQGRQPAIVHCHLIHAGLVGTVAARLAGVPHVITTKHGISSRGRRIGDVYFYYDRLAQALGDRLSDAVIAVSDAVGRAAIQQGTPKGKIVTVYNAVPPPEPKVAQGVAFEGYPIIGAVGSFYRIKGHRFLIEGIPDVLAALPEARFVLVGDGLERGNLERQAAALGVQDRVTFLGYRTDVGQLLHQFDIFVLPSLSEGMPTALLEAMLAGVPVVATGVGGIPEVIEPGKTGLLVPPGDASELAGAIIRLAQDDGLRSGLGERAQDVALTNFSPAREARETENVYNRVLRRAI